MGTYINCQLCGLRAVVTLPPITLNQVETNTYDIASGLLLSTTDRKGNTFTFTYNANGELLTKSLSDGTNAETTVYGLTGVPVSKQNSTSTITYTYNNKGRLVSEPDSVTGATKAYTYDAAGNRVTLTVTRDGTTEMSQSYAYDKLNRLTSVSENGQVIATYTYDNKGNKIQSISNGDTTNYIYNLANMLTSQVTGTKLSETYTYYLNGNQKTKVSNGDTTTYTYDGMNRLVSENDTQYTFDEFGNRATMSDGATTTTYTYDLNNRLTGISKVSGDVTTTEQYAYDNNGNQTSKTVSGTSVASYQYNCYNQLIQASVDGTTASYTYAPDGLRSKKTVGNTVTLFVYDNANIIEELCGNDTNKYYRGIGIIKNGDGLYYLYNGQGDVAMLTNADGAVVASYTFDAYGNAQQDNTVYNPFGYRGEYVDSETGFIYLRARYYDPTTGRFINEDPIRDGLNWYAYCNNNPVMFVDPSGEKPTVEEAALMVQDLYSDFDDDIYVTLLGGWSREKTIRKLGMYMGVYLRVNDDGNVEYSLVSKGSLTEFFGDDWLQTYSDWINNIRGPFGASYDIRAGIKEAQKFVKKHSGNEITFVGHSKGGAEASANALATNKNAILFNPMSINTLAYGLRPSNYTANMTAYIVKGEALNNIFGKFFKPSGNLVYLPSQYDSSVDNHSMSAIIKYLLKR